MNSKKAFTLIELLVVIAIIAILAAILFPVFAQAKAAAKKTSSVSNFKQIATATFLYSGDADDVYPLKRVVASNAQVAAGSVRYPPASRRQERWAALTWRELSGPYVKNGISMYPWMSADMTTPAPRADKGMWESTVRPNALDVIDMHQYLGTGGGDPYSDTAAKKEYQPLSQTALARPADTTLLVEKGVGTWDGSVGGGENFEINWWGYQNRDGSWPPRLKGNADPIEGDNNVWPSYEVPRYRHSGNSTTMAFADSHVRAITKGKLNWCRNIHIEGMDPGQEWLYDPGNPCAGEER